MVDRVLDTAPEQAAAVAATAVAAERTVALGRELMEWDRRELMDVPVAELDEELVHLLSEVGQSRPRKSEDGRAFTAKLLLRCADLAYAGSVAKREEAFTDRADILVGLLREWLATPAGEAAYRDDFAVSFGVFLITVGRTEEAAAKLMQARHLPDGIHDACDMAGAAWRAWKVEREPLY